MSLRPKSDFAHLTLLQPFMITKKVSYLKTELSVPYFTSKKLFEIARLSVQ